VRKAKGTEDPIKVLEQRREKENTGIRPQTKTGKKKLDTWGRYGAWLLQGIGR